VATEIRRKSVTVPAGTTKAANFTADLSFPARVVREIDILVPPGPRGELGFRIGAAGVPVIPVDAGAYIVTDNEAIHWPLDGLWDSGSFTLFAYNTGRYPHTLEIRFLVDLAGAPDRLAKPIDPALLASVGSFVPVTGPGGAAPPIPAPIIPPVISAPPIAPPIAPPALPPPPVLLPPPVIAPPSGPQSSVASWYQELLGRPADPEGVRFWMGMTRGNGGALTFDQAVVRFLGTLEAQRDAVANPAAFVAGLYRVLLGHDGGADGIGYWAGRLKTPANPGGDLSAVGVAQAIAASPEAQARYGGAGVTVVA
jgi:hypothetical protein